MARNQACWRTARQHKWNAAKLQSRERALLGCSMLQAKATGGAPPTLRSLSLFLFLASQMIDCRRGRAFPKRTASRCDASLSTSCRATRYLVAAQNQFLALSARIATEWSFAPTRPIMLKEIEKERERARVLISRWLATNYGVS